MIDTSLVVRTAEPDEAEACIALWGAAVAARDGGPVDPAVVERARTKFAAPQVCTLVAVGPGDGDVIGFALVTEPGTGRPSDPADAAYLSLVAVHPGAQAGGVGQLLLRAAVDAARAAGHPRIVLHVLADNHRAVRLYAAGGFVPTEVEFPHALTGTTTRTFVADTAASSTPPS